MTERDDDWGIGISDTRFLPRAAGDPAQREQADATADGYCDVCGGCGLESRPICRACENTPADVAEQTADLRAKLERCERDLVTLRFDLAREEHIRAGVEDELTAATARAETAERLGQALADAAHALVGHERPRMREPEREALRNAIAAWDTRKEGDDAEG